MTSYGNRDGQIQHVSGFEVAVIKVEDEKKARTEDPLGQPSGWDTDVIPTPEPAVYDVLTVEAEDEGKPPNNFRDHL
ncbi:hypothetical protein V6N13_034907 [Hibiscus sabdariffa]